MSKLTPIAVVCAAITSFTVAQADPAHSSRVGDALTAQDGFVARSAQAARGERGALIRRQGITADGQGNVAGGTASGFATASGAQGARTGKFNRSADGAVTASGQSSANGPHGGSADRSGSFTRNADGTASGERSTTTTNANTGVTFDGSTTYNGDTGVSRSASCTDAAGNTVACLSR